MLDTGSSMCYQLHRITEETSLLLFT